MCCCSSATVSYNPPLASPVPNLTITCPWCAFRRCPSSRPQLVLSPELPLPGACTTPLPRTSTKLQLVEGLAARREPAGQTFESSTKFRRYTFGGLRSGMVIFIANGTKGRCGVKGRKQRGGGRGYCAATKGRRTVESAVKTAREREREKRSGNRGVHPALRSLKEEMIAIMVGNASQHERGFRECDSREGVTCTPLSFAIFAIESGRLGRSGFSPWLFTTFLRCAAMVEQGSRPTKMLGFMKK